MQTGTLASVHLPSRLRAVIENRLMHAIDHVDERLFPARRK